MTQKLWPVAVYLITVYLYAAEVSLKIAPESLDGMKQYGCSIRLISDLLQPHPHVLWHVDVWAEFPDLKWSRLLSVRPQSDRRKSLKDCDLWMAQIQKRLPK